MVSVAEGDGMVSVCATLSALDVTEKNFAITLTTSDKIGFMRFLKRGAFGGSDYTSVSTDEFFPSGSTNGSIRCVNITIEDDNSLEENETFTVTVTAAPDVVLEATITIVDNDGMMALGGGWAGGTTESLIVAHIYSCECDHPSHNEC